MFQSFIKALLINLRKELHTWGVGRPGRMLIHTHARGGGVDKNGEIGWILGVRKYSYVITNLKIMKLVSFRLFLDTPPPQKNALWTTTCRYKHLQHM